MLERSHTFAWLKSGLSEKAVQMKFYVPDEATKIVLDRRRNDLAALQGKTLSDITTDALISALLPSVKEAVVPVARVLLGDCGEEGKKGQVVASTLADLFLDNCDGPLIAVKHTNYYPLVEYSYHYLVRGSDWGKEESALRFRRDAISYWRVMLERVKAAAPKSYVERRIDLERTADLWQEMLCQLEDGYAPPYPMNFLRLIQDCWDILYEDAATYRFIGFMLKSVVIFREDLAEQRNDFQIACEQVMSCWGDADAEKREALAAIEPKTNMRSIFLANGDICRIPTDFVVMNEGDASSATNVIVCEVPDYERFGCPNHMVFFADCDLVRWRESGGEEVAIGMINRNYPSRSDPKMEHRLKLFRELSDGPSCKTKPPYCAAIYRCGWDS